jgi:hypothetical protein
MAASSRPPEKKKAAPVGRPKSREETPKEGNKAAKRIAASHCNKMGAA